MSRELSQKEKIKCFDFLQTWLKQATVEDRKKFSDMINGEYDGVPCACHSKDLVEIAEAFWWKRST